MNSYDGKPASKLPRIMKALNKICFTICIVCIVLTTVLAFALIWGSGDKEFLWKGDCQSWSCSLPRQRR